jgi:hypothetical protein
VCVSQCMSNTMPVVLPSCNVGDKSILLVELGQEGGQMPENKTMIGKSKDDDKDNTKTQLFKQHYTTNTIAHHAHCISGTTWSKGHGATFASSSLQGKTVGKYE